jgi:hypothetical protein
MLLVEGGMELSGMAVLASCLAEALMALSSLKKGDARGGVWRVASLRS